MADSTTNASRRRRSEPHSPPKQATGRTRSKITSQSPPQQTRGGRALRSQSKDTVDGEGTKNTGRGARRGIQRASVESTGSEDMKAGRRKGKGRAVKTAAGDLSTVPEDSLVIEQPEADQGGRGRLDSQENIVEEYNDEELIEAAESPAAHSTASGISGTTVRTSHSAQEIADMNTDLILEALPNLSHISTRLLRVLTPANATEDDIGKITKDLLLPASQFSKTLKYLEGAFMNERDQFGNDQYIIRSTVNKALLGVRMTKDIGTGPWSPDLVLQKANLAIFALKLLVYQRGSQDLWATVALLDSNFPVPFLSTLDQDSDSVIGSSQLLRETFDLGLNLRTQLMLILLSQHASSSNYDPEKILAHAFFEPSGPPGSDRLKGWAVPGLGGSGSKLPAEFEQLVLERVKLIRNLFADNSDSLFVTGEPGDVPEELKRLVESFPWTKFLLELAGWVNLRLGEIEADMAEQGGADTIVEALREEIERRQIERGNAREEDDDEDDEEDGQAQGPLIDLTFNPSTARFQGGSDQEGGPGKLLPAAEITEKGRGASFNKLPAIRLLRNRETRLSFEKEVANPEAVDRAGELELGEDDWQPQQDDEDDLTDHYAAQTSSARSRQAGQPVSSTLPPSSSIPLSSAMVVARYEAIQREKNKENHQIEGERVDKGKRDDRSAPRQRFIDPQPRREVVQFGDGFDDSQPTSFQKPRTVASSRKRPRPTEEPDEESSEEESSEPEEFETDTRPVNQSRRKRVRTGRQVQQIQPEETIVVGDSESSEPSPPRTRRVQIAPQQEQRRESTRQQKRPAARSPPEDDDFASPQSSPQSSRAEPVSSRSDFTQIPYSSINQTAKESKAKAFQYKPQVRRAWSIEETTRFIELVEQYGVSWARIERLNDPLLYRRTQVNLKDKARNIKMDYLKSGTDLPPNFEHIRLNRLQIKQLEDMGVQHHQGEQD